MAWSHGVMTDVGAHREAVSRLDGSLDALIAVVQGLLVHEHLAGLYGVSLDDGARAAVHERRAEAILDRVVALDDAPLDRPRPPERRVAGNCRQISVLLAALLGAHGVPARPRCGFGLWFAPGRGEDHWVCEVQVDGRWVLVDAQLDALQQDLFGVDFPTTDVPRDRYLVAGAAWTACRAGDDDPDRFGLSVVDEAGLWWVGQNLVRDAASLTGLPLLPWDVWGAMPVPGAPLPDDVGALLDRVAALTLDPDRHAAELAALMADDPRLRVPERVHNALRQADEPVP